MEKDNVVFQVLVTSQIDLIKKHIQYILTQVRSNEWKDLEPFVERLESMEDEKDIDHETRLLVWRTFFLVSLRRDRKVRDYVCMGFFEGRPCGPLSYKKASVFLPALQFLTDRYMENELQEETFVDRAIDLFITEILINLQSWSS